MTKFQPGNFVI